MPRPVTLFTGQWADLPFEVMCEKAAAFGYDGIELACWGDHFDVASAKDSDDYCKKHWATLTRHKLGCYAVSSHLVGQAICDRIDERHKGILPPHVWGDGNPEGVRTRAAAEMMDTARAARRFFNLAPQSVRQGLKRVVVNGFTGSSIWPLVYSFPPNLPKQIDDGYADFARRWRPILDAFDQCDVHFALEVHPTEIAFDLVSAERALQAVGNHPRFGFNYDPSHFGYQGVDYVAFIRRFGPRLFHMHVKDVWWSPTPTPIGVFGGHADFGHADRYWDFRSPGRGRIDFEAIIRALNAVGYDGPLSVEWEDGAMDREHGAREACAFVRRLQFAPSAAAFDAAFARE
ncbi:MAG: sugar phosphate isomerase/epimerase [Phycisphaerales bacterium]|nr:sugar phosphate isomerase/epimerase [Phycisphaerales bacterium]